MGCGEREAFGQRGPPGPWIPRRIRTNDTTVFWPEHCLTMAQGSLPVGDLPPASATGTKAAHFLSMSVPLGCFLAGELHGSSAVSLN